MRIFGIEIRKTSGLANPDPWLVDQLISGYRSQAGPVVSESSALRMSAVYACVRVLSESVAQLPLILYRRDGDRKSRATDHPLYGLLHDTPNPEMTAFTFRQTMMAHLCLRGNAYAEIELDRRGRPIALWPIPQDQYSVTVTRENGALAYQVKPVNTNGQDMRLPASIVLHLMGLSLNGLTGLSPIAQARQGIGLGLAAEEFGARFFSNGAALGGVLKHPGRLSEEAAKRLRESWTNRQVGLGKAHSTAILEEGMQYESIGIPPQDAQFLETRQFQVTDIARMFRVPPHMIGDLSRATWNNIESQGIDFVMHSLGPWLRNWEQALAWKLLTREERREYFVEFLVDALLRGDTLARYQAYAVGRQNGWLSANDIRRLENMDPIDGGDIYLIPLNMVPADQAGKPHPDPTKPAPTSTRSIERRAHPHGPEARRQLAQVYAPVFQDVLRRIFSRERADVLRQARKRSVTGTSLIAWLQDYYEEHPQFCAKTILPALESYADAVGRTTTEETDQDWDGLPDELRDFLGEYAAGFGLRESISSRMRTVSRVKAADEAGESIPDSLEAMFDEWERARLQDDTQHETVQGANAIAKTVYVLAGISSLCWASGATACPLCLSMEGRVVSITKSFLVQGDTVEGGEEVTPLVVERDLGHPPLHRGCVCQVKPG